MSFQPVFLDEPLDGRASMTFLRHFNRCERSGYLYAKHRRRGAQTVEMVRGSAVHAICERATNTMLDVSERSIPPELVKAIVNEVLRDYAVPLEEHDYLRELAYRWASQWELREDETVIAVERLFVLELNGWQVRCKVDFASKDAENRIYVADLKSGRGAPNYDEIARKRPGVDVLAPAEQRLAAKSLQLVLYVLAIAFGRPVEIAEVPCDCRMTVEGAIGRANWDNHCPLCDETGIASQEEIIGEQVARGCPEAIAEYVYPGIERKDTGLMLRQPMGLTRLEMLEYLESLETLLARVDAAEKSGDWPAVTSDAACSECPCMAECPIPSELRDFQGRINTPEEAREALQRRYIRQKQDRALGRELRVFVEKVVAGPLRYGDRVAEIVPRLSTETDREALIEALTGGMDENEARLRFVKTSTGTTFAERDLTADEIEQEKANGTKRSPATSQDDPERAAAS